MNKKLITAILTLSLIVPVTAHVAQADTPKPTVAILDTGIDTSLPAFQGKIVQEVCLLEWTTCPNGQSYMEGPGAASMPANLIVKNGFDHGTFMTSVLLQTNPNMNVVFIKIVGNTASGARQNVGEGAVYNALRWVKANANKYNIQAVTMAQGHHRLGLAGTDYCPKTPVTVQSIKDLISIGIPTFFPSGNGRDYKRIDWPACLDESISVGYVDRQFEISTGSNTDPSKLDFFALGFYTIAGPGNVAKNISGSSAAIQAAAAYWIQLKSAKPNYSYEQLLNAFKSTSSYTIGRQGKFSNLININGALASNLTPSIETAPVGPTPEELAAEKAAADAVAQAQAAAIAKLLAQQSLKAQVDSAIALAEAQYQIELKAAQDKLAATKATWLAKLNG